MVRDPEVKKAKNHEFISVQLSLTQLLKIGNQMILVLIFMKATQIYKISDVRCETTWCSSVPIASFLSDGFSWNSLLKSVGSTFYMIMSKKPLTNTFLPIAFHRNECYISVSLHRQNQIELVINRYRCLKNLLLCCMEVRIGQYHRSLKTAPKIEVCIHIWQLTPKKVRKNASKLIGIGL